MNHINNTIAPWRHQSTMVSIKDTNIKVCVRVRPLLVEHSHQLSKLAPSSKRNEQLNPSIRSPIRKSLVLPSDNHASPIIDPSHDNVIAWDVISNNAIQQSAKTERIQGRTISYTVDRAYGSLATTAELYEQSVQPVVRAALEGYHGSVFAYGQTSTERRIP
jgi:hypothetical protein